jgi:hypothetical protein
MLWALTLLTSIACCALASAQTPSATIVFKELTTLVGDWQGYDAQGKQSYSVSYHLTANGSALVETWTLSPGREAITIYALDGSRLLATHYCPRGNQPRLVFAGRDMEGNYRLQFLDGTNLQDPNRTHQHAFWIRIGSADSFLRGEAYVPNGTEAAAQDSEGDMVRYRRTAFVKPR